MNKLKECKLNELYIMSSGISSSKDQAGVGYPFVSFRNIFNNTILPENLTELMNTSDKERIQYSVKKGDVFLTRTSETPDELAMSSVALKDYPNATFSGFAKRLRPIDNKKVYDKYMAFYFRSKHFRRIINANTIMTLRASFNEEIFSYIKIQLPDYETQVKIGDMLYRIEKKILINNQINNNLEELMKIIYQRWFIEFEFPNETGKPYKSNGGKFVYNEYIKREIPENWKVGRFAEITDMYQPITIPTSELKMNGKYNVYGANGIIGKYDKYNHEQNEIAVCCRGAGSGEYLMTLPYSWITGNAMIIKPKPGYDLKEYIYYKLADKDIFNYVTGSAQPQITRTNIENMKILIPTDSVIKIFNNIAQNSRMRMINALQENKRLNSLKEYLLPLLMNGQINVDDIEI